jgi:GNAT superfamily N-acetyltransferase
MISEQPNEFILREATENDIPLIMELITELAAYEKLSDQLLTDAGLLQESVFKRKVAHVLIAECGSLPAGYVMYYYNFSSFIGLPGIYLEDIYIRPGFRGKGYGKASLAYLARLAIENNCWGLEWSVLDWNQPSIEFYKSLGATHRNGWLTYRLKGSALENLAGRK